METPTAIELRTAIEVLNRLGERINNAAYHSKLQMPESQLGNHHAAQVEVSAIEQITRIEIVAAQLQNWHDAVMQQGRQNVS